MKAATLPARPDETAHSVIGDFNELIKSRLTFLVLCTTLVGFYMGWSGPINFLLLVHTMLGTAMAASGASVLNQFLERDFDKLMKRTQNRPLPAGRLGADEVLLLGVVLSVAGIVYLAVAVNFLTAFLGAITIFSYVFCYTPLKRVTTLNTVVGAVPGALPPVMGWTAARGEISYEAWVLFVILFFWQLPHFLAICWMYREEYKQAGFVMLSGADETGAMIGRQAVIYTLGLTAIGLLPTITRLNSAVYFFGALVLGAIFTVCAVRFAMERTRISARILFFASIIYLPLLLGVMVFTKI